MSERRDNRVAISKAAREDPGGGGVERIRFLPPPVPSLDDSRASLGTYLVLLGGSTARTYRSYELIAFDDRHGTPCRQHAPAHGGYDRLNDGGVRL